MDYVQKHYKVKTAELTTVKNFELFSMNSAVKKFRIIFTAEFIAKQIRKCFTTEFIEKKIRKFFTVNFIGKNFDIFSENFLRKIRDMTFR